MKIRDILALPFIFLSVLLEWIGIVVGSKWTSDIILDSYKKLAKKLNNFENIWKN